MLEQSGEELFWLDGRNPHPEIDAALAAADHVTLALEKIEQPIVFCRKNGAPLGDMAIVRPGGGGGGLNEVGRGHTEIRASLLERGDHPGVASDVAAAIAGHARALAQRSDAEHAVLGDLEQAWWRRLE